MNMKRSRIAALMMLVTIAAVWCMGALDADDAPGPVEVDVCRVTMGDVEQVIAITGVVRYEGEYAVIAPSAGIVEEVYVNAGDEVQAGQPLARLSAVVQEATVSALLKADAQRRSAVEGVLEAVKQDGRSLPGNDAALVEASAALDATVLRANAAGRVLHVEVAQNDGILPGNAVALLSAGRQEIMCSVVLRDAQELAQGQYARITAQGEQLCCAEVMSIGPAQAAPTGGQTVCAVRLRPDVVLDLPLGAVVDVDVVLASGRNVPVLPAEVVSEDGMVTWVADGVCWRTDAGVVLRDEVSCWVSLPEGACIVRDPAGLVDGQRVREAER